MGLLSSQWSFDHVPEPVTMQIFRRTSLFALRVVALGSGLSIEQNRHSPSVLERPQHFQG